MKKYILYGATNNTVKKISPYLKNLGIEEDVLYLCDSDSSKYGSKIGRWTIYSREKIKENPEAVIIVLAHSLKGIIEGLRAEGINNKIVTYPWFRWSYMEPVTDKGLERNKSYIEGIEEELYELYNVNDSYTKNILTEIIKERKMVEWKLIENVEDLQNFHSVHDYFYDMELAPKGDVTFIDGGAYDGDSIQSVYRIYGDRLKKIYAFEPAQKNVVRMAENLRNMGLCDITTCYKVGMSDKDGKCFISDDNSEDGMACRMSDTESDNYIEVRKLDSLDLKICGEGMLKMDIEGSELAALRGARNLIRTQHPYMAICLYHKMEDIYEIPAYIKSICDEYDFYLRAGGHLELYAVPKRKEHVGR